MGQGVRNNPYDAYVVRPITLDEDRGSRPYKGLLVCANDGNISVNVPGSDTPVVIPIANSAGNVPVVLPIAVKGVNTTGTTISSPTSNIFGLL